MGMLCDLAMHDRTAYEGAPQRHLRDAGRVRMEEAALNATTVREQMLYDGWLVRWAPSQARRARSINVIGPSLLPLDDRLAWCAAVYARHQLELVARITSIGPDWNLDAQLHERGYSRHGETCVMAAALPGAASVRPELLRFELVNPDRFARAVGALRKHEATQVREHHMRLRTIPTDILPVLAWTDDGHCAAAGMAVFDGALVGIFDLVTHAELRRRGYAGALIAHLLGRAADRGCTTAYLQVETDNTAARSLYARHGFADSYSYWYRSPPGPRVA